MTMDTCDSNDVTLPAAQPLSSFPGKDRVGLSSAFVSPARRFVRTSSDTGNKAIMKKNDTKS